MVVVGCIVSSVASGMAVITPILSKSLIDDAILGKNNDLFLHLLVMMCAVVFGRTVLLFLRKLLFELSTQMMVTNIRVSIFDNIQHQEMRFFDKVRTGDLITRSNADVNHVRHFIAYTLYVIVETTILFIAPIFALGRVNLTLTLVLVAVVPILCLASYLYSKKVGSIYRNIRQSFAQLNNTAQENIEGNRVVKAFAREEFEMEKFAKVSREYRDNNLQAAYERQKLVPVMDFLANSLTFLTLLIGGILVIRDRLTLGELTMFTQLTWALALPMKQMNVILNNYQNFITSSAKIIELCEASPLISDRHDAIADSKPLKGKIEFRNVSFSYEKGKKILDNISFVIHPGETFAIMGPTGSGKTTLINLIARFYDATEGKILLDDVDIRMKKLSDVHHSVSIATQDVFLFSDTVDGNIAYSNPELSEEKVHTYATLAVADGFIRRMEESYDTIIGERGVGISGGQRQRLALARALAEEAPILVLDDTTSAVDMETEKTIQENLASLPTACTKIMIAQRISSVSTADRIMIIENGKIQIGTHEELARTNRYYRGICELQDIGGLPAFEGGER